MITEIISKIADIILNKVALPIAISCALLLFLPTDWLNQLGVLSIRNDYRGIIGIIFIFSISLYLYEKGKIFTKTITKKYNYARQKKQIISRLDSLTNEEGAWIFYCLINNCRTLEATYIHSLAVSLENKGIVFRPRGNYDILVTPYTFTDIVWECLIKHKSKFCPAERLNDPKYNRFVMEVIHSLRSVI